MKKRFLKNSKFRNFTIKLLAGALLFQNTAAFAQPLIETKQLNTFLKRDMYNTYINEGETNMTNQIMIDPEEKTKKIDELMLFFENQNFIKNNQSLKNDIRTALENTNENLIIEAQRIVYALFQTQAKPGSRFNTVYAEIKKIDASNLQENFLKSYHETMTQIGRTKDFDSQQRSNIKQIDVLYDEFFDRNLVSNIELGGIIPSKLEQNAIQNRSIFEILDMALEGRINLDVTISGYDFGDGKLTNISFNVSKQAGIQGSSYENIVNTGNKYENQQKTEIEIDGQSYNITIGHPNQTTFTFENYLKQFRNSTIFDIIRFADLYFGTDMLDYEIINDGQGNLNLNLTIKNENKDTFFKQFNEDPDYRRWMVGMNTLHPLMVESLEELRITQDLNWRTPKNEKELIEHIAKGFVQLPSVLSALEIKNTYGKSNKRLQEIYALANKEDLTLEDIYNLSFMDNNLKNAIQSFYNNPNTTAFNQIPNELKEKYKLAMILCGLTYGVSSRYGNETISSSEFKTIMSKDGEMGDLMRYPIQNHANAYMNAEKLLSELEIFGYQNGWTISEMRNLILKEGKESKIILDKMADLAWKYIIKPNDRNNQLNQNITKEDVRNALEEMKDEKMFFLMYTAAGGRLGLDYSFICDWDEWDLWSKPEGEKLRQALEIQGVNGFYVPNFEFEKLTQGVTELQLSTGETKINSIEKREGVIIGDLTTTGKQDMTVVQLLFQRRQNREGEQVLIIDDTNNNSYNINFSTKINFNGTLFKKDENDKLKEEKIKDKEAKNSWVYLYVTNNEGKIISTEIIKTDEEGNIDYTIDARNLGEIPKEGESTEYNIYALPFDHEYISLMEPAEAPKLVGKIIIGSREKITEIPNIQMPTESQKTEVAFTVPQLDTGSDLSAYQETADILKEGLENLTIIANLSTYEQFRGTNAYSNLKQNFITSIEEYLRPLIKDIDVSDPFTDYEGILDQVLTDLRSNNITIDEAYRTLFGRDPINGDPCGGAVFAIISGSMMGTARTRVNIRVVPGLTYGAMFSTRAVRSLYSEKGITFYSFKIGFEKTGYEAEIIGEGGEIIVTSEDIKEISNFSEKALTTRTISEMGFHIVPLKVILTLKAAREEILSGIDLESILNNEKEITKETRYELGGIIQPLTKSENIFGKVLDKTAIYGGIKFYDEKNVERLYGGGIIFINPIKNNTNIRIGVGTHLEYTTPEGVLRGGGYLTISPNLNLDINTPIGKNWSVGADASALAVYNREEIKQRHYLGLGATGTMGLSIKRRTNLLGQTFEIQLRGEYKKSIFKNEDPIDEFGIKLNILR